MMNNLKLAFIGFGKHARANLYPSLKTLEQELSAVCTTKSESAMLASKEYYIPNVYINHKEMLEKEKPDAVFVCTQSERQIELVKDCLKAGAHVFVEKNLGFNETEAQEIANLSKETRKEVMVGFMKRFSPAYLTAKDFVTSGYFGDVVSMSQMFTSRNFVKTSKEYMLFAAIHYIDLIRFYLGEIKEVKGFETSKDDNLSQSFTCVAESGATASIYFVASPVWDVHVEDIYITGSNGYVMVNGAGKVKMHTKEAKTSNPKWQTLSEKEIVLSTMSSTSSGGLQNLYLNGFVGEIDHFIKSIQAKTRPQNNAEENVKTMRLYDMMVKSLEI